MSSPAFKSIALIGRYKSRDVAVPLLFLARFLVNRGCTVMVEADTAEESGVDSYAIVDYASIGAQADLAIVLGGDGSMLNTCRSLAPSRVPVIGVNQGRLGFLTDIAFGSLTDKMGQILDGQYTIENRTLINVSVSRQGQVVNTPLALNDVVVSKGSSGRLVEMIVHIDREFVYDLRADGLIITTPTGSTAYALSSDGPIIQPNVPGIALVPICPQTLSNRPITIGDASTIDITLKRGQDARLHSDGQPQFDLLDGDRITLKRSEHHVRLVHPPGYSYYAMLREKLHWSESLFQASVVLLNLSIRDFAIVESLELEFERGFTALTGETGAGKSILIDALALALGERADAGSVRAGAERAEVVAEFAVDALTALRVWLAEAALEGDADRILLRRVVDKSGRSRAFINGTPATVQQLVQAGEWLLDIHGQHAHQSLLKNEAQRTLLDTHAGHGALLRDVSAAYREWQRLATALSEFETQASARAAEREQLAWQCEELSKLAPKAGEWDAVQAEQTRLAHAASLIEGAQTALGALSEEQGAVDHVLSTVASKLRALSDYDAALGEIANLLDGAQAQVSEAAADLRRYADRVELDPRRLSEVETRMEALHDAARKFRVHAEELPAVHERAQARLAELDAISDAAALAQQERAAKQAYAALAADLSAQRRAAAGKLARAVTAAMKELAMSAAKFDIVFKELSQGSAAGNEQVEFLVAANAGGELRPLAKVASGGELSRISLAIQVITSKAAAVPSLIFDEVDAGIGGAVAEVVGRKLRELGRERQVFCVTHLPQVAAQADHQWSVAKSSAKGTTQSKVTVLDDKARVEEVARMLGGLEITAITRKHAAELLNSRESRVESRE